MGLIITLLLRYAKHVATFTHIIVIYGETSNHISNIYGVSVSQVARISNQTELNFLIKMN